MPARIRSIALTLSLVVLAAGFAGCGDEPVMAPSRHAVPTKGGLPSVRSLALNPSSVAGGATSTATVTLNGSAPTGGMIVTVSSSNAAVATAPASVTVPAGSATASFTVTSQPVTSAASATISASGGGATASAVLSVSAGAGGGGGTVASITLSPTTVTAGTNSTATVTLSGAAPAGGTPIGVSSNNVAAATVPPNVTVPAGATSTTFIVTSHPVAAPDFAAISATAGQVTQTAVLNVNPSGSAVVSALSISPTLIPSAGTATGTVTLNAVAPAGGAAVTLVSSDVTVATVPASVTVAAGATSATFTVTAQTVPFANAASITASFGGTSAFARITVTEPPPTGRQLLSLTLNPSQVVGGQAVVGTVTLASAVGPDTPVALSSTDPTVATVPATVIVPAGVASATFTVTTLPTTTVGFSVIAGAAGGTNFSASLTTLPPPTGPSIVSIVFFPASLGGTGPATGRITMSGPATGGALVNLTSANSSVVQVPDQVVVSAGASRADFPVTTSRVAANTAVSVTGVACCGGLGTATGSITVTTAAPPPPDVVGIDRAEFIPGGRGGTLNVRATSTSSTAILTVFRDGSTVPTFVLPNLGGGRYEGSFSFSGLKPLTVTVKSNLGGSATSSVR